MADMWLCTWLCAAYKPLTSVLLGHRLPSEFEPPNVAELPAAEDAGLK